VKIQSSSLLQDVVAVINQQAKVVGKSLLHQGQT